LHPRRRRIDAIADAAPLPGDVQPQAPFEQPEHFVGLEIDDRVIVHVERAAVSEQDFDAAALRSNPVTGEERHRRRRGVALAVALEHGGTIDIRDVRRRCLSRILRESLGSCQAHGCHANEPGQAAEHESPRSW
jgi:hypothetical protein